MQTFTTLVLSFLSSPRAVAAATAAVAVAAASLALGADGVDAKVLIGGR
jgi:hypothetical protein